MIFDDLAALSGVQPPARVLEIGSGTGQATLPLAARGYEIIALEPGAQLAAMTARNLQGLKGSVRVTRYDGRIMKTYLAILHVAQRHQVA